MRALHSRPGSRSAIDLSEPTAEHVARRPAQKYRDHRDHHVAEGVEFNAALREASIGRVRPKLMTACTAILGLLPLLVLRLHGTEIEQSLAVVMIGGLVTSTVFTLFALPTFYTFVHRWQ